MGDRSRLQRLALGTTKRVYNHYDMTAYCAICDKVYFIDQAGTFSEVYISHTGKCDCDWACCALTSLGPQQHGVEHFAYRRTDPVDYAEAKFVNKPNSAMWRALTPYQRLLLLSDSEVLPIRRSLYGVRFLDSDEGYIATAQVFGLDNLVIASPQMEYEDTRFRAAVWQELGFIANVLQPRYHKTEDMFYLHPIQNWKVIPN